MKTKHTPGPWDLQDAETTHCKGNRLIWANGHPIAEVFPCGCAASLTPNASLIAAAPDLLAALENLLADYNTLKKEAASLRKEKLGKYILVQDVLEKEALAAIKKAKGIL